MATPITEPEAVLRRTVWKNISYVQQCELSLVTPLGKANPWNLEAAVPLEAFVAFNLEQSGPVNVWTPSTADLQAHDWYVTTRELLIQAS